jgi:glycosyltransferase involved in cell wall biosynthesis
MKVSIIIPCYNESQNIAILLDEIFKIFSENKTGLSEENCFLKLQLIWPSHLLV